MHIRELLAVVTTCAFVALSVSARDDAQTSSPAVAKSGVETSSAVIGGHLYDRIAVVGASASDGFGVFVREDSPAPDPADPTAKPAKKNPQVRLNLADVLRFANSLPRSDGKSATKITVHHYASGFFFSNPGPVGRGEIDRALAAKPTLVLGLDFLFWYVYGTVTANGKLMQTGEERLANLEAGLAQLDRVLAAGIPLVISDIPDMHDAIGKMLSKNQVPTEVTLASVNARLSEWLQTRPTAKLIALSRILGVLKSGGSIDLAGRTWDPAEFGELLQKDQLHPTFAGTVIIAAALIDVARANDTASAPPFDFSPNKIRAKVLEKQAAKSAPITEDSPTTR